MPDSVTEINEKASWRRKTSYISTAVSGIEKVLQGPVTEDVPVAQLQCCIPGDDRFVEVAARPCSWLFWIGAKADV